MIDIHAESLLPINQVPKALPEPPHVATVWRWIQRGVRGIKLETVLVGGKRYTSAEKLQAFVVESGSASMGQCLGKKPNIVKPIM